MIPTNLRKLANEMVTSVEAVVAELSNEKKELTGEIAKKAKVIALLEEREKNLKHKEEMFEKQKELVEKQKLANRTKQKQLEVKETNLNKKIKQVSALMSV